MNVLTEGEFEARVDFMRPLHPEPEKAPGLWCIPFEYGSNAKGTKISISKAREIAAELRAEIAEAEMALLRRCFDDEVKRSASLSKELSKANEDKFDGERAMANLKAAHRKQRRSR